MSCKPILKASILITLAMSIVCWLVGLALCNEVNLEFDSQPVTGSWVERTYSGGHLLVFLPKDDGILGLVGNPLTNEYLIETKLRVLAAGLDRAGIIFGFDYATGSYYNYSLYASGELGLTKIENSGQSEVLLGISPLELGGDISDWNELAVVVDSELIECYLNGTLVLKVTQPVFPGGDAGLFAEGSFVSFDYFRILDKQAGLGTSPPDEDTTGTPTWTPPTPNYGRAQIVVRFGYCTWNPSDYGIEFVMHVHLENIGGATARGVSYRALLWVDGYSSGRVWDSKTGSIPDIPAGGLASRVIYLDGWYGGWICPSVEIYYGGGDSPEIADWECSYWP